MQRIYLPNIQFSENLLIEDTEIHHQLTRVMRARIGDDFIFFDGKNLRDYLYKITQINKTQIFFSLQKIIQKKSEISSELFLYQAFPNKLEKLEFIIQKCCEIGYKKIIFFHGDYSQKIIISENKKNRLQKIAIEAIEQCGGNSIPEIEFLETSGTLLFNSLSLQERETTGMSSSPGGEELRRCFMKQGKELFVFCHTHSENSQKLSHIDFSGIEKINLFVGPEGGFSPSEIEYFESNNFIRIYFGERILRTETVGVSLGFYISQS